jgi:N-glycosylase/DNA lyase
MRTVIRDARSQPRAFLDESSGIKRLIDAKTNRLLGTYIEGSDITYDANSKFVGKTNLLLTLLR